MPRKSHKRNVGSAAAALCVYYVVMFLSWRYGGRLLAKAVLALQPEIARGELLATLGLYLPLLAGLVSVGVAIPIVGILARPILRDTTATGAAWVVGSLGDNVLALGLGLALGAASGMVAVEGSIHMHRFHEWANGLDSVILVTAFGALLGALAEELLYRGVVLARLTSAFGSWGAWTAVSLLYYSSHFLNWPLAVGQMCTLAVLSVATLVMRVRSTAVGPAVSLHAAHNLVLVFFMVCVQSRVIY